MLQVVCYDDAMPGMMVNIAEDKAQGERLSGNLENLVMSGILTAIREMSWTY